MIILNLVAFQAGWFASILGAAKGVFFLGPVTVCTLYALHLYLHRHIAREVTLGGIFILCGFFIDTGLTVLDVYTPSAYIFHAPFSPPWLIFMWLNFATIFNVSLKWMHGKYFLASLLGGIGGALTYYGGASFGALEFMAPVTRNLLVTGLVWAVLTPFLLYIVKKTNERFSV